MNSDSVKKEIEITPEMVKAGKEAYFAWEDDGGGTAELVKAIYLAMKNFSEGYRGWKYFVGVWLGEKYQERVSPPFLMGRKTLRPNVFFFCKMTPM